MKLLGVNCIDVSGGKKEAFYNKLELIKCSQIDGAATVKKFVTKGHEYCISDIADININGHKYAVFLPWYAEGVNDDVPSLLVYDNDVKRDVVQRGNLVFCKKTADYDKADKDPNSEYMDTVFFCRAIEGLTNDEIYEISAWYEQNRLDLTAYLYKHRPPQETQDKELLELAEAIGPLVEYIRKRDRQDRDE